MKGRQSGLSYSMIYQKSQNFRTRVETENKSGKVYIVLEKRGVSGNFRTAPAWGRTTGTKEKSSQKENIENIILQKLKVFFGELFMGKPGMGAIWHLYRKLVYIVLYTAAYNEAPLSVYRPIVLKSI